MNFRLAIQYCYKAETKHLWSNDAESLKKSYLQKNGKQYQLPWVKTTGVRLFSSTMCIVFFLAYVYRQKLTLYYYAPIKVITEYETQGPSETNCMQFTVATTMIFYSLTIT